MILTGGILFAEEDPVESPAGATESSSLSTDTSSWTVPSVEAVFAELKFWLDSGEKLDQAQYDAIMASWDDVESFAPISCTALQDRTVSSMRLASKAVADYLDACDALAWKEHPFGQTLTLPQLPLHIYLGEGASTGFLQSALRYYLGLKLVQGRFYEEALPILNELGPGNSLDYPGVLINRAIVCNHLLRQQKGKEALTEFRSIVEEYKNVPRRYLELAKQLEFDLDKKRDPEDPENISRQMNNVRRRLGQGRTDDDTQQAEGDVMKSLEKLIEKIEQQAKQAQGEGGQGGQGNTPAEDSRPLKQKGPGNVDRRDFDPDGNWGDLPPKEREEALLKIEKEFPSHYRDIIEQYFREMATRNAD